MLIDDPSPAPAGKLTYASELELPLRATSKPIFKVSDYAVSISDFIRLAHSCAPALPENDENVLHFPDFPYNVDNIFYAQGL